ncbi:MAG: aspartate kinase [Candidatus Ancillula sp.]|jgi:aspartate kinase|nr:aspartate kinase [Candidatus Ancillula sp.]
MLVVQKFGGSSVADVEHIQRVAKRIYSYASRGDQVVAVVSAMGDTTDELIDLSQQITKKPSRREMDILMTAGERISMSLLAMAVTELGVKAKSFTGQQAGIFTNEEYGKAHIADVVPERISKTLAKGQVAIVAGFQGLHKGSRDVTTLGRGGSDTTAVALAAALKADVCEIYSDVDGVFTADPRICPKAHKIAAVEYDEMLEMAASGAKILALRCVEYARRFNVKVHVRSSFSDKEGTIIGKETKMDVEDLEAPLITGIAHDSSESKVTIVGVPDRPGVAARVFELMSSKDINVDMIVQNVSTQVQGYTDISFTLPSSQGNSAIEALSAVKDQVGFNRIELDDRVGKVSLIGVGMKTNSGVSSKFFAALRDADVNVEMISTSEIRISVITRANQLPAAVQALHTAFELDSEQEEAVVYGGTGR